MEKKPNNPMIEQMLKLAEVADVLTKKQAKEFVDFLVKLNKEQLSQLKEELVAKSEEFSNTVSQETFTQIQNALIEIKEKAHDNQLEVRQLTNKQKKVHEAKMAQLEGLIEEFRNFEIPEPVEIDREGIITETLSRIPIIETPEEIGGEDIAEKLNALEEVIDQKVIRGLTKKITDLSSNIAHNVIKGSSTTLVNGKLAKNINFSGSASVSYNGDNANVTITGGGGGAVDSVNGQTGTVVLDTGDIAEATDLNYVSDAQLTVIGNTSGTNTGDVTLAGEDYLSIVGQVITANAIDLDNLSATGTPDNTKFLRGDNTWATPAGSGDVSKVGTPVNTQVGYWTGDGTLAGDAGLTYNATTNVLTATGFVGALTGNADTVTTNANLTGVVTSTGNATAIADNALSIAKTSGLQTALDSKLASSFTKAQLDTAVSDGNVLFVGDITQYTDELAQDAVGGIVANSTFINLAYNDGTPSVTASLSATGTPDNTTYLRGDNTWATISSGGATTALDNLASVAINTSLISDTNNTDDLGSTAIRWRKGWFTDGEFTNMITIGGTSLTDVSQTLTNKNLTSGTNTFPTFNQNTTGSAATLTNTRTIWGQNFNGSANVTGDITLGTGNITMTGSIGATGARATKVWTADIESTNMPTVGGTAILTSLTAPQFTTIELGHATDTTLSRVSAGVIAVEGKTLANLTDGGTFIADISVPDEAYGSGWDSNTEVPTKNAVYDKIETLSYTPAYLGITATPNSAQTTVANTAYTLAITVPVACTITKVAVYIGVSSGNIDVGIYNSSGTRLGSSGSVASPGVGSQLISLSSSVALTPGFYYLAVAANNATISLGRYSTDNLLGSGAVATSFPLPSTLTTPIAVSSRAYSIAGVVSGGVTQ